MLVLSILLNEVERTQSGRARCGEYDICALLDLCPRQFFSFDGIVPRRTCHADVILNNTNVGIDGARSFFVSDFELADQGNVHAAKKSERAGFRLERGNHPHEIGSFVLFKNE